MKNLLLTAGLFFALTACDSSNKTPEDTEPAVEPAAMLPVSQQAVFEPAFETINVPFSEFEYNTREGLSFEMETGSRIEIPADAFEDKNGNPVTKNIHIEYREFHSVTDVILSGIKMKYNEGDTTEADFETAGMFEIRAFQNEAELNLRADKTIKVDLASYKSGDFKHYKMNEKSTNWEFLNNGNSKKNTRKQEKLKALNEQEKSLGATCSTEPQEYKPDMKIFDLNYDLGRFAELQFVNEAMWVCVGSDEEKKQLEKSLSGFDDMELVPQDSCNVFQLNVWKKDGATSIRNKKSFRVMPVWSGKALKRVQKNYRENVRQMKELQDQRQVTEREADLWRSFELKGMGVYNCDLIMDYLKFVTVSLAVIFKDKIKSFFYITNNGTVAIKYYQSHFDEFKLNPSSTNSIIAILPDNKIGTVSEEEFAKAIDAYQRNTGTNKQLELQVIEEDLPVTNKASLEQHVARY